jgi:hypothetical protein
MSAVYLGLALMFFLTRSAPPSPARSALVLGAVVALSLLVALGVYEFASGHAARGILVSASVEFVLALGFARTLIVDRRMLSA